jgi:hypothetical protein
MHLTASGWFGLFLIFTSCSVWAAEARNLPLFVLLALLAIGSFKPIVITDESAPM